MRWVSEMPFDLSAFLEAYLPEVKGLTDFLLIFLVWGGSVMVRGVIQGVMEKPPWLAGDRDMIVPAILATAAAFIAEWTTPEFNLLIAVKKFMVLFIGVLFLWKPSMLLQAIPDFILKIWPISLGGDALRQSVEQRAKEQIEQPLRTLTEEPPKGG